MRLLFAEDEADLNRIVTEKLKRSGYSVDSCTDGEEAIGMLDAAEYDGVILDIMMPGTDGYAVLKHLRDVGRQTPVLFLTARDAIADRIRGLDAGANDYLIKPFSMDELLARIRAMTRAVYGLPESRLTAGDLVMDLAARTVTRGGRPIALSAREFALLEYMMHNRNIVLSREKIEDHIWNFDYEGGTNVVDVYISYLRKKIDAGAEHKLIQTVRGSGYVLRADD